MAPVSGGQFFGGSTLPIAARSTPLETLVKPTSTGPNLVPNSTTEAIDAEAGEHEKEGAGQEKKGLGEFATPESKCGRNRCRQRGTSRSRAAGTRCRARPEVRQLHGGFASHGSVVKGLRRRHRGHAGNRCLLGGPLSDPGRLRIASERSECAAHQDVAWTQVGRAGKPMAPEAAHFRVVEQFVPADRRDPGVAFLHAPAGEVG